MITLSSREILRAAEFYANVKNSSLMSFFDKVQLLNSAYSKLYIDLVKESDSYISYFDFVDKSQLPDDCYLIMSVYKVYSNGTLEEIYPMPKDEVLYGSYYRVENNVIIVDSKERGLTYRAKYSTMPSTLTAPDEPIDIDITYTEIGKMTSKGFYYKENEDDTGHFYSFDTEESTESTYVASNNEITDFSTYAISGLTAVKGYEDYPYAVVTYSNNDTYIWTGNTNALYNINAIHGHNTEITPMALKTDDFTGKGLLYVEDGQLKYGSFVPDTILSYPSQIYFQLLEYEIASILQSLNGMDNRILEEKLIPEAKVKFYETVKTSSKPYRQGNVMRHIWR